MSGWATEAEAAIRAAAGAEAADRLDAAWRRHAERDRPEITLFGPYDSGKSSLLKRLLVDAGADVPGWLTVSSQRETFELNEVDVLGWTFTDAPGVAGGNPRHEQLAHDALALSDAFLVVVPPQLMTSDRDELLAVLSGRVYAPDGWPYPPGALRVVIARIDEAGIDPMEDEAGFRVLAADKRAELGDILAANAIDAGQIAVNLVAADPFGAVANEPHPAPANYDLGRGWDGVGELADALRATAAGWRGMREAARVRFLLYVGHQVLGTVDEALGELRLAVDDLARGAEHRAKADNELDELVSAARADLDLRIDEALRPVVTTAAAGGDLAAALQASLNAVFSEWQLHWDVALSRLADESLEEVARLVGRPAGISPAGVLGTPAPPAAGPEIGDGARVRETFALAAPHLRAALKSGIELKLGMSIEQAQRQLARLDELTGVGDYSVAAGFSSMDEADRTRRYVVASESGGELLEAVGELAAVTGTIAQLFADDRRRRGAEEREAAIRERARHSAEGMVTTFLEGSRGDGVEGWLAGVDRLRAHVHERLVDDRVVGAFTAEERELSAARGRLAEVLARAPAP